MTTPRVLHEDARLVAIDKPAGPVVVPGRDGGPSILAELSASRGERLWVVHRLDAGTSGVLVFARDAAAHRHLSLAFEGRDVEKVYLAVVRGVPPWDAITVEVPLHAARRGKMRPAAPGEQGARDARTDLRVIERGTDRALVEARPRTGRQHQIRVHLRYAGFPLLLDPLYGARTHPEIDRTPLHAARIDLPHPDGGRRVIESPLPADVARLL